METECQRCKKIFEDSNFERFGSENAKRIYCDECIDVLWKDKKLKSK